MSTVIGLPTKTSYQRVYNSYRVFKQAWDRWQYRAHEYNQYGLYLSDLYSELNEDVREAVRRLPDDLYNGRLHRHHRAIQFSRNKIILPEAMWTKQEDPMHQYMEPYLQEIYKENAERAEWNKK